MVLAKLYYNYKLGEVYLKLVSSSDTLRLSSMGWGCLSAFWLCFFSCSLLFAP